MRINGPGLGLNTQSAAGIGRTAKPEQSFGEAIRKSISDVNKLQTNADQLAAKMATGEGVEVHQAMIAMQKASTALQFTIQVRNKIVEAYQEIMKMQV